MVQCEGFLVLMQILTWNIRVLGSIVKKRFLSKLIKKRKPDMVFVQETKLEAVERVDIQKIWGSANLEFICSGSVGASGGLLSIWNKEFFTVNNMVVQRSFISMSGLLYGEFPCTLVNVYASNEAVARRVLWEELLVLKAGCNAPWCIAGDFNEIRVISERVGCLRLERGMMEFSKFCNNMELIDLPMLGRKYTWTNYQNHAIHSRLDRFLVSQHWLEKYNILQWGLPRPISDHCPVTITDDSKDWGPKPFKFMDIWLSNPKCMTLAKETWNEVQVVGWAGFILVQKLKAIKDRLKIWNKEEFGDVNSALQDNEAKLHQLDMVAEGRPLDPEEKALRCKVRAEY